jgi:hypothetical protein
MICDGQKCQRNFTLRREVQKISIGAGLGVQLAI